MCVWWWAVLNTRFTSCSGGGIPLAQGHAGPTAHDRTLAHTNAVAMWWQRCAARPQGHLAEPHRHPTSVARSVIDESVPQHPEPDPRRPRESRETRARELKVANELCGSSFVAVFKNLGIALFFKLVNRGWAPALARRTPQMTLDT